ncbi:methyl-accepting chemotaxis protein [Reinekea sp. G2M2-21]|uniref:methyl-accepting chemotaxis protein n=1 Tax=Reinekea sp. G2M2-21 TaxID=2788942 RepID=UPI0018A91D8D|nr:HAMP domain-containing methyl-accepting chemotaxis protein [Reinekea sp. G2M2-21]
MAANPIQIGNGFTIKVKTIALVSVIILIVLVANAFIVGQIRGINGQVAEQAKQIDSQITLVERQQTSIQDAQSVIERVNKINAAITTIADMNYWYFQGALTLLIESVETGRELQQQLLSQLADLESQDPASTEVFASVREELETYKLYVERMFVMYESNSVSMGASMAQGAKDQSDKVSTLLNTLRSKYVAQQADAMQLVVDAAGNVAAASKVVDQGGTLIRKQVDTSVRAAIMVTFIVVVIGAVMGLVFLRGLLIPIRNLTQVIQNIESTNNVSLRTQYHRKDELGYIANAFDSMMNKFQGTIERMSESASDLMAIANSARSGSVELSASVRAQQEETDMVATATTQMSASAHNIKQNTDQASDLAADAKTTTNSGRQTMERSVASLEDLTNRVTAAAQVIDDLAKNTDEIGSVLDVIRGISEQTNLLALNAAIEAARAGEQGRGFAVVADEVRNLASRTNQSTIEIQETVAKLQEGAQSAVAEIEKSKSSGLENMQRIREAADTMAEVANAVEQINELNGQIAQASGEQSEVAGSIDESISRISSQVSELSENASKRERAAESLRDISEQLKSLVDSFVTR